MMLVTKQQVIGALVLGGGAMAAAERLQVCRKTIDRAVHAYNLRLPERRLVSDVAAWDRLYRQHGGVAAVAKALAVSHSYVHRMLEEHGIRPMRDEWADRQEAVE